MNDRLNRMYADIVLSRSTSPDSLNLAPVQIERNNLFGCNSLTGKRGIYNLMLFIAIKTLLR